MQGAQTNDVFTLLPSNGAEVICRRRSDRAGTSRNSEVTSEVSFAMMAPSLSKASSAGWGWGAKGESQLGEPVPSGRWLGDRAGVYGCPAWEHESLDGDGVTAIGGNSINEAGAKLQPPQRVGLPDPPCQHASREALCLSSYGILTLGLSLTLEHAEDPHLKVSAW